MGKPRDPYELQKVTINLRRGDMTWLQHYHGLLGASKVIREMVAAHVDRVTEAVEQAEEPNE